MPYRLSRLAPASYDVLLNGVIIASLVRSGESDNTTRTAELLLDLPPEEGPPFTASEHSFRSLEEAQKWLGGAQIRDTRQLGLSNERALCPRNKSPGKPAENGPCP